MLGALFTLLGCQLAGEILHNLLHLPIPGPVIGMVLLAAGLAVRERRTEQAGPTPLDRLSGLLLRHMGLLFVPAGVGLVAVAGLLKRDWLPIVGGVLGSTVLSLVVTGFVMHRITRTGGEASR